VIEPSARPTYAQGSSKVLKQIQEMFGRIVYIRCYLFPDDHDVLGRTYLIHAIHGECQEETIEYILSLNFNTNHQAQGVYIHTYHKKS
jgi:hypothetical protein